MSKKIVVTLTAYNMGDVSEADFDAWHRYVCEHIDEAVGFEVHEVDQHNFANGPAKSTIVGATDEEEAAIREWLSHGGYEAFCATPEAWPNARRVVVAGMGASSGWATVHAESVRAVGRDDDEIWTRARERDLLRRLEARGGCAAAGADGRVEILDDGWLVVLPAGIVDDSVLDADPAVVAYCTL